MALLDGTQAERAMDAVRDIRDALTPSVVATTGPSLGGGMAGIALFHAALGEATGDAAETARASELMDAAIDAVVEQERLDPSYFGTTVGVGWAMSRLGRRLGEPDEANDVDELVVQLLGIDPWPAHFDVVTGLAGRGAYCADRLPFAGSGVGLAVARLASMARDEPDGAAWLTTPAIYGPRADRFPEGHYDVGFAHGNAGVVAFLALAVSAGTPGAEDLLRRAVAWLVARRMDDGSFPSVVTPDGVAEPARMAWCYGDPGIAVALVAAGRALSDDSVVAVARETALRCVGRVENAGVADASLCHGSVGAAHLFARLGDAFGEESLVESARYWARRALDDRRPEGAVAGFAGKLMPGSEKEKPSYGLVDGVAGTGLGLITAATGLEPWWDYPLLLANQEK